MTRLKKISEIMAFLTGKILFIGRKIELSASPTAVAEKEPFSSPVDAFQAGKLIVPHMPL